MQQATQRSLALCWTGWGLRIAKSAFSCDGQLAGMTAEECTNLSLHLTHPVEPSSVEMPNTEIDHTVQQPETINRVRQAHEACAAKTKDRGGASVREEDVRQHSGEVDIRRLCSGLYWSTRVASGNEPFRLITDNNGTCANDGTSADRDTRTNKRISTYPNIGPNGDRKGVELKVIRLVIVSSSAKMHALRYNSPLSEVDKGHRITDYTSSKGGIVFHTKIPWRPDLNGVVYIAMGSNLGTEKA